MTTSRNAEQYSLRALGGLIRLSTLFPLSVDRAQPLPVLLVIADGRDFCRQEYARVRHELATRGLRVVVAIDGIDATSDASCDVRAVPPDVAIGEVSAGDYSAMMFVGERDVSRYQYQNALPRASESLAHQPDPFAADAVDRLIGRFIAQHKPVAAYSHGVSALAWAGVDCVSPLQDHACGGPSPSPAFAPGIVSQLWSPPARTRWDSARS
jgi:putative intracellular protease/amidase